MFENETMRDSQKMAETPCKRDWESEIRRLKARLGAVSDLKDALLGYRRGVWYIESDASYSFASLVGQAVIEINALESEIQSAILEQKREAQR